MPPRGTKQELPQINRAAADIAAHQVRVHAFERRRSENSPRQNTIAETRRKALDLGFQAWQHVELGAIRDVAVSPGYVAVLGSTRRVEQRRLGEEDEWTLRMMTMPHRFF